MNNFFKNSFILQILRFGIVGTITAMVHFAVVITLVESGVLHPLSANVFGFFVAFNVSYAGHRYWTFRGTEVSHRIAMPRLFVMAGTSFFANQSLFYFFYSVFHWPYMLALLIVLLIMPAVTFAVSKVWIFR